MLKIGQRVKFIRNDDAHPFYNKPLVIMKVEAEGYGLGSPYYRTIRPNWSDIAESWHDCSDYTEHDIQPVSEQLDFSFTGII